MVWLDGASFKPFASQLLSGEEGIPVNDGRVGSTFEPLTGIVIGVIVFHEVLSMKEMIGMIGILTATVLLVLPLDRVREKEQII